MTGGGWRGHGNLRYATHFTVSFLRFLAQQRKRPRFPIHIVGTNTIRGKAQRYEGSREDKDRSTSGEEGPSAGQGLEIGRKRGARGESHGSARREERFLTFVRNDR